MSAQEEDLSQRRSIAKDREPMILDKARLILQNVANAPEDTFAKNYDLSKIDDRSYADLRRAFVIVAADLLATHLHEDTHKKRINSSLISKQTPHGRLNFGILSGEDPSRGDGYVGQSKSLQMELMNVDSYIFKSVLFLEDRDASWVWDDYEEIAEIFIDQRELVRTALVFMHRTSSGGEKEEMDKSKKIQHGLR